MLIYGMRILMRCVVLLALICTLVASGCNSRSRVLLVHSGWESLEAVEHTHGRNPELDEILTHRYGLPESISNRAIAQTLPVLLFDKYPAYPPLGCTYPYGEDPERDRILMEQSQRSTDNYWRQRLESEFCIEEYDFVVIGDFSDYIEVRK